MKDTQERTQQMQNQADAEALFERAKEDIAMDMKTRDIGVILWDNSQAGFHYPPEVSVSNSDGKESVWTIHGIYRVDSTLYLIGPGARISVDDFYKKGIETKPVVYTLNEDMAERTIGIPNEGRGYTSQGSIQEWLTIADCYFAALNLINKI